MPLSDDRVSYSKSVPCALKKYLQTSNYTRDLSEVSIEERQLAFQHWVAYNLSGQSHLHLDGHFKCPLTACSNTESSFESCLAHLSSCSRLSNSWYWCPSCEKGEQFAEPIPASTGVSKIGPASRIVGFVTSAIPKSSSAKSTTGGFWKHFSNKLDFRSHPPKVKDNMMGKAELDGASMHEQRFIFSARDEALVGSPANIAAEKDGSPVQRFAPGNVHFAATCFSPDHLSTAELGSTHSTELHGSLPSSGLYPKHSELSADDPDQCIEASTSKNTTAPAYTEPQSKLSTHANDGHAGSELDLVYLTDQRDVPHLDHPLPYQIKTFENLRATQGLGNRPFTSKPTAVLPEGLKPIEMPVTMPETLRSSLTDERRSDLSYGQLMVVPGDPSQGSDRSDPQDSFQPTNSLQYHGMDLSPLDQWPFTRDCLDDDCSLEKVRSPWYLHNQAPQSGHVQRTAVANWLGGQAECRNHSQDSHFVSPMGGPGLYSLPEHPCIVSTSSPVFNRDIPGDQYSSLGSSTILQANRDTQAPDASGSFNCSSSSVPYEGHQLEARLRTPPASSLSERYSFSSSSPSTSAASSHRDSMRSSKISFSTQATSAETSLVSPSNQHSFEVTAAPGDPDLEEISKCLECSSERPATFSGKPRDRRSYLNRHIRTCHGEKKFLCPFHGCPMESSRPDNVRKHLRTVDHDVTLKRSNARRKKRNVSY
ncbi:MAG: hypothetical protein LQ337_001282 [Flavoplaca oasis]|nr:MAG: hypothetical protein LQ337_001282 [Flavoplaca oasis]